MSFARGVVYTVVAVLLSTLIPGAVLRASDERVLRIAGDNNFPPFEYMSESGSYTGFNVDVLNAISIETGLKIELVPMSWNQALQALETGEVDAIQGMKYSQSRDLLYDFSDPYFTSSQGIFVLADNMYIHQIADLEGRRVALQKGDIANDLLAQLKHAAIVTTESQEEALQLLLNGKVDAFVGNRITGQYFVQRENQQHRIKIVGEPIDPTAYGVAVMPHNRDLLTQINQGIAEIKRNGTYEKIERKWFGEYMMPSAVQLQRVLLYLQLGLIASMLVFLGIFWWNRQLKREVSRRTNEISAINQQLQEKMKQLQESNQFQQQLLDSTYSSYLTLDLAMNISLTNRKAAQYLPLTESNSPINFKETELSQIIPAEEVADALSNGRAYQERESRWFQPGRHKQERIMRYSIYPIYATSGEITGAIVNFQDVTEQKEMERKIEQEDRLRLLGQMMLGIAHEIRNPLMSILTYTQLLPKKFDSPRFREFFAQQVPREIQRLNSLVSDLLDYAQPKHSQPTRFSVEQLISSVLLLLKPQIRGKELRVQTTLPAEVTAYADPQQIKQVLINLVINAIDAMQPGGLLQIRAYYDEQMTVIEVADDGHGLDSDELERIFEPFHTTKPNGVGLGLSISYQLVKRNKGLIETRSRRGEGTTMIIQLPRPEEGVESHASFNRY